MGETAEARGKGCGRKMDGAERYGLEEVHIARYLYLPNLDMQFISIIIELCVLCTGFLGLEIYCNTHS